MRQHGRVMRTEPETAEPGSQPRTFGMMVELFRGGDVVVLSGAGLSTESGIPDYRGPSGLARRGQPMTYQAFTGSAAARQRYWARSHLGWRHIAGAAPNAGHLAVAELERHGLLRGIITQNVDGLHQAAGGRAVTELHGSLHRVVCLSCWRRTPRPALDERLRAANPAWSDLGRGRGGQPGRGRGARGDRRVRGRRLRAVRRGAEAGRGVLRRERAEAAGRLLLRPGRRRGGAGGPRVVADRHVRVPVRTARGLRSAFRW